MALALQGAHYPMSKINSHTANQVWDKELLMGNEESEAGLYLLSQCVWVSIKLLHLNWASTRRLILVLHPQ